VAVSQSGRGADIYNGPASAAPHRFDGGQCGAHGCEDFDGHGVHPAGQKPHGIWLGRVVDKNVEAAKGRLRESHETVDLILIFHVRGVERCASSVGLNQRHRFVSARIVGIADHHGHPFLGKSPRDGTAGSFPARAGDDRDLAIQVHS